MVQCSREFSECQHNGPYIPLMQEHKGQMSISYPEVNSSSDDSVNIFFEGDDSVSMIALEVNIPIPKLPDNYMNLWRYCFLF